MYDIWICNGFVVIFDGSRLPAQRTPPKRTSCKGFTAIGNRRSPRGACWPALGFAISYL